jgi:hypothetical protein
VTNQTTNLNESVYTVKQLFGHEEPHLEVFARNLAEQIKKLTNNNQSKPLIVSIGLQKSDQKDLKLLKNFESIILGLFKSNLLEKEKQI